MQRTGLVGWVTPLYGGRWRWHIAYKGKTIESQVASTRKQAEAERDACIERRHRERDYKRGYMDPCNRLRINQKPQHHYAPEHGPVQQVDTGVAW